MPQNSGANNPRGIRQGSIDTSIMTKASFVDKASFVNKASFVDKVSFVNKVNFVDLTHCPRESKKAGD